MKPTTGSTTKPITNNRMETTKNTKPIVRLENRSCLHSLASMMLSYVRLFIEYSFFLGHPCCRKDNKASFCQVNTSVASEKPGQVGVCSTADEGIGQPINGQLENKPTGEITVSDHAMPGRTDAGHFPSPKVQIVIFGNDERHPNTAAVSGSKPFIVSGRMTFLKICSSISWGELRHGPKCCRKLTCFRAAGAPNQRKQMAATVD